MTRSFIVCFRCDRTCLEGTPTLFHQNWLLTEPAKFLYQGTDFDDFTLFVHALPNVLRTSIVASPDRAQCQNTSPGSFQTITARGARGPGNARVAFQQRGPENASPRKQSASRCHNRASGDVVTRPVWLQAPCNLGPS